MTLIQTFHGNATNGTELTAVYAEQPAANVAFALVFPGNDLPRLVHWGRPLAAPATAIDMFDAQMPQRVSGALDYTSWPSVLPTQSESWIGATRFDVRRDGVELFCKFAVSNITAHDVGFASCHGFGGDVADCELAEQFHAVAAYVEAGCANPGFGLRGQYAWP